MFWRGVSVLVLVLGGLSLSGCASGPRLGGYSGASILEPLPAPETPAPEAGWNAGLEVVPEAPMPDKQAWPPAYFAYDKSAIGDAEKPKLDRIFEHLTQNPNAHLLIEGHCDERGGEEYNRALGERRALAVRKYLTDLGIDGSRLHTLSYGEERPAATGKTEEAYRLNRRAELIIMPAKGAAAAGP